MAQIKNHKYTIESAFRECFYVVPDYQREYVWTDKEVNRLLEDIDDQIDSSSEYFIGTVLVAPSEEEKDQKGHFDIIDGQQRLTTAFLILCALRRIFTLKGMPDRSKMIDELVSRSYTDLKGDIKTSFKLDPRYKDAGEVIKEIVNTNNEPKAVRAAIEKPDTSISGSVEKILNAYDAICRFLTNNYDDETRLREYWAHLANSVVFIQISANIGSVLKIFETINERGVGLNSMDLLKNLLFAQISPEGFSKLKEEWKKITDKLEENKEKPLRFLKYFLMANYKIKNERNNAIVREDEIYDWFTKKENAALTGYKKKPFPFVDKIDRNAKRYIDFRNGKGNDSKPNLNMDALKRLTGSAFSLHYVWLLAAANLPKSLFDQFVTQLESFLFYHIFTKTHARDLERNFSIWADEIRDIANIKKSSKQIEELNAFVKKRFADNMNKKLPELKDALKRLTIDSMPLYRTRYLLSRLTQHVDMAFTGRKDRGNLESYSDFQIEHILPKNPKDGLRETWEQKNPESSYDEMKNRLGNLTPLEKPINIVASNNFYSEKVRGYAKSSYYLTRSLSKIDDVGKNTSISRINRTLSSFDKWDAEDIEKRQSLLIDLALDIWKITKITASPKK